MARTPCTWPISFSAIRPRWVVPKLTSTAWAATSPRLATRHRLHDQRPRPGSLLAAPRPNGACRHQSGKRRRGSPLSALALSRPALPPRWTEAHSAPDLAMPDAAVQSDRARGCGPTRGRTTAFDLGPRHRLSLCLAHCLRPAPGSAPGRAFLAHAVSAPGRPRRSARSHPPSVHDARACCRWFAPPTACSCRPRSSETPCLQRGIAADKLVLLGMGVDPAECTGGDRQSRSPGLGIGRGRRGGRTPGESKHRKGHRGFATSGRVRLAAGASVFACCWPGRRCRTFAGSGQAYAAQSDRSIAWAGSASQRNAISSPASICSPCRVVPIRSAWCCWKRGRTACRTWRIGPAAIAGVIRHEEDGLLVRCGDIAELAAALGDGA